MRFQLTPPSELSPTRRGSGFELSPDGRYLVMSNATGIWVRALDAVESHQIARVEGPTYPFWSPDGAWIGFFAEGQLRKIPARAVRHRRSATPWRDAAAPGVRTG